MAERKLLIDSDAFVVLAGGNLLDAALGALGVEFADALRLQPLRPMLGNSRAMRTRYPADVLLQSQLACDRIAPILDAPDPEVHGKLLAVRDIDQGEALLYSLLAERPSYLLASGDKRAMRALCATATVADIREAVRGRVICLEGLVRRLVEREGVEMIAKSLAPLLPSHTTLRIVFTTENASSSERCLAALDSYLDHLRTEVGAGFLHEL